MNTTKLKHSLNHDASIVDKLSCTFCNMDIGERIEKARTTAKLDRYQLASACGISYQAVQQWEVGKTKPGAKTLLAIARATKTNPDWLVEGKGQMMLNAISDQPTPIYNANIEPAPALKRPVPLISWVAAGDWCEAHDPLFTGEAEMWLPAAANYGTRTYGLRVRGASMEPRFREGEIIIVDPDAHADSGRFVIAKKTGSQDVTFKQLIREGDAAYLKPLNPAWPEPIIKIDGEWHICGAVVCKMELF